MKKHALLSPTRTIQWMHCPATSRKIKLRVYLSDRSEFRTVEGLTEAEISLGNIYMNKAKPKGFMLERL